MTIKKLLLLFVLNISLSVFTQELNKTKDGYSKIVDVELSKKEIYQKLNEWIGLNYVSAKDVLYFPSKTSPPFSYFQL